MKTINQIKKEINSLKNPQKAETLQRFFKTGKGQYGEGDIFLGLTVPQMRKIAKKYFKETNLAEAKQLLAAATHESRLTGLLILVYKFEKANQEQQTEIVDFYLANTSRINNWDLVDLSCHQILGSYLVDHPQKRTLLDQLADSKNMWEQRIAMVSTYAFIKNNQLEYTFEIAQKLLNHPHDLIHKAVGWMLREAGKRNQAQLERFLQKNYSQLPRTTLRYAIEKFEETKRKRYLRGEFKK
jgi:3-methyladenine DNA glycosylase AlkD